MSSAVILRTVSSMGLSLKFVRAGARGRSDYSRVRGGKLRHLLAPEPLRRKVSALAHGPELRPDDAGGDPFAPREGAKPAIRRSDDPLAVADRSHSLLDAARNHFRMFDEIAGRLDHARDQDHVLRERMLLEGRIFMLVARVGELDRQRPGPGLVENREHLRERDVVDVRTFPVAPADV